MFSERGCYYSSGQCVDLVTDCLFGTAGLLALRHATRERLAQRGTHDDEPTHPQRF